jgi:hypothetical protein
MIFGLEKHAYYHRQAQAHIKVTCDQSAALSDFGTLLVACGQGASVASFPILLLFSIVISGFFRLGCAATSPDGRLKSPVQSALKSP